MPRTYPVGQAAREVLRGLPQTKKYSPFGLPSMLQQKSRGHRTAMAQASRDENSTYSKESGVGRSKGCREMAATQSIWRKPGGRRSSFYSRCCRSFVPDDLTAFMTYHATVPSTMLAVLAMRRAFADRHELVLSADLGISNGAVVDPTEQELENYDVARVDPTEQELGNCNAARVDPTEHKLGNCNAARVDPIEHELGNYDVSRVDPTEHELRNYDVSRVDPTEHELGNCDVARVDPIEQELGNYNVSRVDPTE
ncbi:hypothetical protein B296_00034983 [Ensete ventricosum]|uniref:Uncharacterized protein n=1 Tax=Ensete ventricosum TaxID=4639 RepID=A0A426YN15_ENSVE|nr:hypothetical protein B296_00034983 [Ensete ventricosum]